MPDSTTWAEVLSTLISGGDLSAAEAGWAMRQVLSGEATPAQIAGFAVALRTKGETAAEIEGLVDTMYEFAAPVRFAGRAVDIVGTGGDRSRTVNLSTMAAVVTAAAGVPVVKHGNRAASSACGSADVLEALGVRLDLPVDAVERIGAQVGITFCFAPVFHPALRHSAVPRRELGVATTFNFLGPLANPARPAAQAVGVADRRMAPLIAQVLSRRGVSGFVFRGDDGLDELTTTTTSAVWAIAGGRVTQHVLDPARLGLPRAAPADLVGGDVAANTAAVRRVLAGETGPVRDAVLLNAAAGIAAVDTGDAALEDRLAEGLRRAADAVDTGAAKAKLEQWVRAVEAVTP